MFGGKKEDVSELRVVKNDLEVAKRDYKTAKEYYERERLEVDSKHKREVEELVHTHKLALQTKDFDMKHFKDTELKKAIDEKVALEKKVAVLEAENKMLNKLTDLNGDVLDVKDLVKSLVNKLPTIDLKSLTVQNVTK